MRQPEGNVALIDRRERSLNRTIRQLALPAVAENLLQTVVFFADSFPAWAVEDDQTG